MVSRLLLTHGAGCAEISQCTAKQVLYSALFDHTQTTRSMDTDSALY